MREDSWHTLVHKERKLKLGNIHTQMESSAGNKLTEYQVVCCLHNSALFIHNTK